MVFYEGAISFESLKTITLPELFWLLDDAEKITKLREKQISK